MTDGLLDGGRQGGLDGSYSVTKLSCWCGSHEGVERKSPYESLSSIHILYNQALVGGLTLSNTFDPATQT